MNNNKCIVQIKQPENFDLVQEYANGIYKEWAEKVKVHPDNEKTLESLFQYLDNCLLKNCMPSDFYYKAFGIIMVTNLASGLITPPVGACLYMGSVISGLRVEQIIRDLIPFYVVLIISLLCIILLPQMSQGFVDLIY